VREPAPPQLEHPNPAWDVAGDSVVNAPTGLPDGSCQRRLKTDPFSSAKVDPLGSCF